MEKDKKGLNLPMIKKSGALDKPKSVNIPEIDLGKKNAVNSIINTRTSSIQEEILNSERGLDLVLVGDLTASMTDYHDLLKSKFAELSQKLYQMIDNLRIGIIFYLDHHNGTNSSGPDNMYITRVQKFTTNTKDLINFIYSSSTGNGYDWEEAVEDALHDLKNMNWKKNNSRSVVFFGDAGPHEASDCPFHYDYFEITEKLYKDKTTINTVFCEQNYQQEYLQRLENVNVGDFSHRIAHCEPERFANFFSWIANVTGGMILNVERVDDLIDIIAASAAKDSGNLDKFEQELKTFRPEKLKLIEIAKKAENRKAISGNNNIKRLE